MTVLTAEDVGGAHSYIPHARPNFARSMASIRNEGGPWKCKSCNGASLLCYRCSICGADLASGGSTHGRQT